ncbi:MAG: XRE family transcriptional regulator [Bacillota bacterium]|nr:MAG: XRE family transcriptional regulator [Bacillota bacterium]
MDDLGRRLRRIRKSRNLSIYEVERRTGMHFSTISKYERNERQPSLEILRELAAVYEVPVTALIADITDLEAVLPPRVAAVARDLLERPELLEAAERLAAMTGDQVRALLAFLERLGVAPARPPRAPLQGAGAAPEGRGEEPGPSGP